MNVYQVHNLTIIDPGLGVQFIYQLEGEYLAINKDGLYDMVPSASDIHLFMATSGYLCMLNQTLYLLKIWTGAHVHHFRVITTQRPITV